jgi:hypothetical protein
MDVTKEMIAQVEAQIDAKVAEKIAKTVFTHPAENTWSITTSDQILPVYPPAPLDYNLIRLIIKEEILMSLPAIALGILDVLKKEGMVLYCAVPPTEDTEERQI